MPFDVLLDEDGAAAGVVMLKTASLRTLVSPRQLLAGLRSKRAGHRQQNAGRRPLQLGATLVIGPGNVLRYADYEDFAGDHADIDEVIAAIR